MIFLRLSYDHPLICPFLLSATYFGPRYLMLEYGQGADKYSAGDGRTYGRLVRLWTLAMIQTASHLITGDSPMGVMLSGRDTVTHIQAQLRFSRARARVEARRGPLLTAIVHYLREEHKDYRQLPVPAPTATASEYFTAQAGAFPHLAHTLAEMVLTSPGVLQEFMHDS